MHCTAKPMSDLMLARWTLRWCCPTSNVISLTGLGQHSVILTKRPFRTRYRWRRTFRAAYVVARRRVASNTASAMTAATMSKISAITKTAAQLPVQVVNTWLAFAELIQHQQTAAL